MARKQTAPASDRIPPPAPPGTRERLLAAAAAEFAARGFAGTRVDRIAAAARVNKAMIYYHFGSKAALYQEILGDMFQAVNANVRRVAAAADPPEEKLAQFVAAIAREAEARPHFPQIWFREIAEGGVHLGEPALGDMAGVVLTLGTILDQGVRSRRFRRTDPLLVHATIVAPLLLFFASAGVRRRLDRAGLSGAGGITRDAVVAHVQRITRSLVEGRV